MKVHRIKEQLEVYKSRLNKNTESYDLFPFEALSNYNENWDIEDIWTLIEQVGSAAFGLHKKDLL